MILVCPKSLDHINNIKDKDIGFIIGLKDYSIFSELKLDIDDISKLNISNKVYISINRPIHNNEIDNIKSKLIELSKLNISGIMFEDISIYQINKELGLNLNLIWNTLHLPTNSYSCSYWHDLGCSGAVLSTELMVDDFINIKKNTNMDIYVYLYGHIPIFESNRELISNYLIHKNVDKKSNNYLIYEKERNKFFNIYEEYNNTYITEDILDGINAIPKLKDIDYIIMNSLLIPEDEFNKELDNYLNGIKKDNTFTGFLYKESIFKVK